MPSVQINGVEMIPARDVAALLGVTVGTFRNQKAEGRFGVEGVRIGSTIYYPLTAVQRLAVERGR
ncbi:hypothetical protein ACIQY8_25740 [Streptomyces albidoflavus]